MPIRLDEENLLFAQRQLTGIETKVYERDYSRQFKMANGEILPVVVMQEYEAKRFIEIAELDVFGMAEVISDYSKGGPRVGVVARRQQYPIRTIGDHAAWSWEEILMAQAENIPLEEKSLGATRIAYEAKLNRTGYFGDIEYGLPGIFTSNIARMTSATTFAAAANPDALLALLNNPVSALVQATRGFEVPQIVVLPARQGQQVGNTMRSTNSDVSVLSAFLDLQQKLGQVKQVIIDDNLRGAGTNGEDCMLILPDEEEAICLAIAMDYTILPVQQINLEYVVHALGRIIGAMVIRQMSGLIVEGI